MELNPIEEVLANHTGPYRRAADGAWCINTLYLRKRSGYRYPKFIHQLQVAIAAANLPAGELPDLLRIPEPVVAGGTTAADSAAYVFTEEQFNKVYPLSKGIPSQGVKYMINVMFENVKAAAAKAEVEEEQKQEAEAEAEAPKVHAGDDQQLDFLPTPDEMAEDSTETIINYDDFVKAKGSFHMKFKKVIDQFYYPSEGVDQLLHIYGTIGAPKTETGAYVGGMRRVNFLAELERVLKLLRLNYRVKTAEAEFETAVLVDFDSAISKVVQCGQRQARVSSTNAHKSLLMHNIIGAEDARKITKEGMEAYLMELLDGAKDEGPRKNRRSGQKPVELSEGQKQLILELQALTAENAEGQQRINRLVHGVPRA